MVGPFGSRNQAIFWQMVIHPTTIDSGESPLVDTIQRIRDMHSLTYILRRSLLLRVLSFLVFVAKNDTFLHTFSRNAFSARFTPNGAISFEI